MVEVDCNISIPSKALIRITSTDLRTRFSDIALQPDAITGTQALKIAVLAHLPNSKLIKFPVKNPFGSNDTFNVEELRINRDPWPQEGLSRRLQSVHGQVSP